MKLQILFLALVAVPSSAQYQINWSAFSGGGGASAGGVYSVSATIGQPIATMSSGGGYTLSSGYWSVLGVVETPGAPSLSISHQGSRIVVSWPIPAAGWVLDQTKDVAGAPSAWTTVNDPYQTNATHVFISTPTPTGNSFYRLRKP